MSCWIGYFRGFLLLFSHSVFHHFVVCEHPPKLRLHKLRRHGTQPQTTGTQAVSSPLPSFLLVTSGAPPPPQHAFPLLSLNRDGALWNLHPWHT